MRSRRARRSGIAWQGNIRSVEGWVILKGTPKQELCRRFVAFVADAERQAVFARYINSSPTLPGATGAPRSRHARR